MNEGFSSEDPLEFINQDFLRFSETVQQEEFRHPYIAATAVGLLSFDDLEDQGRFVLEEMLRFYNTREKGIDGKDIVGFTDAGRGKHLFGSLLRHVGTLLAKATEEGKEQKFVLEGQGLEAVNGLEVSSKPQSNNDDERENYVFEGEVEIPLSEVKGRVSTRALSNLIEENLRSKLVKGEIIPKPRIRDCEEYETSSSLDFSGLRDEEISLWDLTNISAKGVSVDGPKGAIVFRYFISPWLHSGRMLDNDAIRDSIKLDYFDGKENFQRVFKSDPTEERRKRIWETITSTEVLEREMNIESILKWYESPKKPEEDVRQEFGGLTHYDIKPVYVEKIRDELNRRMKEVYERKLESLRTQAENDPTPANQFNYAMNLLISDREGAKKYFAKTMRSDFLIFANLAMAGITQEKETHPIAEAIKDVEKALEKE